ncbi:MAG: ssDNA-binding protein, mitochondrial [Thelocarpon impressellum]|nr:MAG: ssDNA-binding protein, mitochondrial [Thelocarpon impressellum]
MAARALARPRPLTSAPSHTILRAFSSTPCAMVAKISIVGRLAAEPELQPTASGNDVVKYAVGTSYGPRDNRQTSWFRVASFEAEGPRRDYLLGLQKGTLVYVDGEASMRTFEDKEGQTRSALNIVQRSLEVLKRPEGARVEETA